MSLEILLIIAGMAVVTYIPRMLPLVFLDVERVPGWLKNLLENVPYAALGALIFPGILLFHDQVWYGIIGGATALVVAYFSANIILVVLSSISVLIILQLFLS